MRKVAINEVNYAKLQHHRRSTALSIELSNGTTQGFQNYVFYFIYLFIFFQQMMGYFLVNHMDQKSQIMHKLYELCNIFCNIFERNF